MHRFFPTIIGPLIATYNPKVIVEIGAANGAHTTLLLRDAEKRNAVLHSIDPDPRFPAAEWTLKHPGALVFHKALSIDTLPTIPKPDLVLIDGDHNYGTVSKELAILCADPASMPLILLHDVGWPYGRRDMYHDPSLMPPEDVHPNRQCGLLPNGSGFAAPGDGVNPRTFHAEKEGGPKNGVLTAVEDAITVMSPAPRFILVPGFHGLGILAPMHLEKTHPTTWKFLDLLGVTDLIHTHILAVERDRYTARSDYEVRVRLHQDALKQLEKGPH